MRCRHSQALANTTLERWRRSRLSSVQLNKEKKPGASHHHSLSLVSMLILPVIVQQNTMWHIGMSLSSLQPPFFTKKRLHRPHFNGHTSTSGSGPCARPNAIVTVVALYDDAQILPLPEMYGKNLTFKTGGVDGCNCKETLQLIAEGKIDTTPLITHTYALKDITDAYEVFESKKDGVIKIAVEC